MNRSAIVLAAHGARSDLAAGAITRGHAKRVAELTDVNEVVVAFHHGLPTFATVLDSLEAIDVTVVPIMTSEGYFTTQVLPRELRRNRRYPLIRLRQTMPLGALPGVRSMMCHRAANMLRRFECKPADTTIVVVGHGTVRHKRSASATLAAAVHLRDTMCGVQVLHAFLDQGPYVQDVYDRIATPNVVVLPFLIGGGDHAARDIPARLGLTVPPGATPPWTGRIGAHTVLCDVSVGTYPELANVIAETALTCAGSWPAQQTEVA